MIKRLLLLTCMGGTAQAMVFDNRFLPLFLKPFTRRCDALSHLRVQPFFMHGDRAFEDDGILTIPDINGCYDQQFLARALVDTGFPEPIRSDLRLLPSIPWARRGRIDAQGVAFLYEQSLTPWLSVGVNMAFAHVAVRHKFSLSGPGEQLPVGDQEYLYQVKEKMHQDLGICPPVFSKTLFGDVDLYLRLGCICDYTLMFRRIDASVKFGVYIPSAEARDLNNPASISLGGNKHWGIYGGFESEWELREDLLFGLMFRAIKRLKKTHDFRMPLQRFSASGAPLPTEPEEYGVLKGPVEVNPGWTFVFNPSVETRHLRAGFGLKAMYTLVAHTHDTFSDRRSVELREKFPSFLPEHRSSWGSEYISVGAFYDFEKVHECPTLYPKISLYWDIPVGWLVSKRAAKTTSVSLMFELDF